MASTRFIIICAFLIFGFIYVLYYIQSSIDSAECGAASSECLSSKICQCNRNDCECCDQCMKCLGPENKVKCAKHIGCTEKCMNRIESHDEEELYDGVEDGTDLLLSRRAHIEIYDGNPPLFSLLTSIYEHEFNWTVIRFDKTFSLAADNAVDGIRTILSAKNCTVTFWDTCLSWNKCTKKCLKFGATSSRWFHNGCCQCIGEKCIDFGISVSSCKLCPDPAILHGYGASEDVVDNQEYTKKTEPKQEV